MNTNELKSYIEKRMFELNSKALECHDTLATKKLSDLSKKYVEQDIEKYTFAWNELFKLAEMFNLFN